MTKAKPIFRYRREWVHPNGAPMSLLEIEMAAFIHRLTPEQGGLGAEAHFKRIVKVLWPDYLWLSDDPDIPPEAHWNDIMLRNALATNYLALTGPASSTKSEFAAIWALVNWIPRFSRCLVIITSTHKGEAKKRIWGAIKERFQKAKKAIPELPGKYNETLSMIMANDGSPLLKHLSDRSSIALVAPDAGAEGDAVGKLIGLKQQFVFVVADELTDMSPAIINACANLSKNPNFHLVGIGNADSTLDPHGRMCEPKEGWQSITVGSQVWETKNGICVHLDGEFTPNRYTKPMNKYTFIIKTTDNDQDAENYGRSSKKYYRMNRGFWCPSGNDDNLYSDLELAQKGCYEHATWLGTTVGVAFLDPAYKTGGDNCQAAFAKLGDNNRGLRVLDITDNFAIKEDVEKDDESVTKQRARMFVEECRKRSISVRQAGVDCSGGGSLMADAVEDAFGEKGLLRVEFGGDASELVIEKKEDKDRPGQHIEVTAKMKYGNKATEIWHVVTKFIAQGQVLGITAKMAEQMTQRRTFEKGKKTYIESKKDFKLRTTKKSPDESDAGLGTVEVARQRLSFTIRGLTSKAAKSGSAQKAASRFAALNAPPKAGYQPTMRYGTGVR